MDKFDSMLEANAITHRALQKCKSLIISRESILKEEVESYVGMLLTQNGVVSSFKGVYDYPYNMCISINDEVIHGIPKEKAMIVKGDIVSLDFGVIYNGYCADAAISFVNEEKKVTVLSKKHKLVKKTSSALENAIVALQDNFPNCKVSQIIKAIQEEGKGYGVIDTYGGHGIGEALHEKGIFIPNSFEALPMDFDLNIGDYFTLEPMFTLGTIETITDEDGYTIKTEDGSLSAHFEYSLTITKEGVVILK